MPGARSGRRARVVPFVDKLERDRNKNLEALVSKAKLMRPEGFESIVWDDPVWTVISGRLAKLTSKNSKSASFYFSHSARLGSEPLIDSWSDVAKSLFILRFHRKHQAAPNQRSFITAVGYVSYFASQLGQDLAALTPEAMDNACVAISRHYSESTSYNLHKHIAEFGAHCDANGLCKVLLQFKYAKMVRPSSTGGLNHKRLDDPAVLETSSDKLISPAVFRVIGELFRNVPKDHKYRFYILMLSMLACTGRRFSEISLLPFQSVSFDDDGRSFIEYFPRKASRGDVFTPKRRLYLASESSPIIVDILGELSRITREARMVAHEMHVTRGPDLTFLSHISGEKRLYNEDLVDLGISKAAIAINGWIRMAGYVWKERKQINVKERTFEKVVRYTNKSGVTKYCYRDFSGKMLKPFCIDQFGKEYYLKDLAFIRPLGLSSGSYAHWLATNCTQSMFTTFLRYFPELSAEYASSSIEVNFTSHHFRHTLNTLLDEGGLSDLLQTEWFGRSNPAHTKAYQHTSREKRALMLREDVKKGLVGGQIAEQIRMAPVEVRDVILKARIQAVHDVGAGMCIHNFSQTPCERHLQCSADCKDYVWAKDDKGRLEELKRQYALAAVARKTAERQLESGKPKKSSDWIAHNDKKLKTLGAQLADNGVEQFDPEKYLSEVGGG